MGFFSELDVDLQSREIDIVDPELERLLRWCEALEKRWDELDKIRPQDPVDPLYDLYYYADHETEADEVPWTIQGVLQALREVDRQILAYEAEQRMRIEQLQAVLESGAEPDGQIVLAAKLFPIEELWITAA